MGGTLPSHPKLSFLGGQQACEPVKLLCGNEVRVLWVSEDPLSACIFLCETKVLKTTYIFTKSCRYRLSLYFLVEM